MSYKISYYKKDRTVHLLDSNLRTIADCLKYNSDTKPDHNAVVFASGNGSRVAVTFKELYENSTSVAKRFLSLGVKQHDYVAVSMRTCPEWLYVFFGAMFARARPVNLSFTFKDGSDVMAMMEKLKTCSTIVLDPGEDEENWKIFQNLVTKYERNGYAKSEKMPYLKYLVYHNGPKESQSVLTLTDMMSWKNVSIDLPEIYPDDVFTLFQTSGSTGAPKAVVHTHKSFLPAAKSWVDALIMDSDSIYFNDRPFVWGGGFPSTVITGQTRVTRLGTSTPAEDSVAWTFEVVNRERCTHMYALPLGFHSLLERQNEVGDDWPLHALITGGQPISQKSAHCIGKLCKIFGNLYGSVEQWLTCCSMVDKIEDFVEYSIGKPLEGAEIKIVDENEEIVPVNEKGELYVKNEGMFKEYCNDPELTRACFTNDGWYKTDDIGYMTDDGTFFCTGRKSEVMLSGGLNVTPSILEAILSSCPGVARAACVPVSDDVMFQVVCACIIVHNGSDVTEESIRRYCEDMHTDKPRLFTVLPTYYLFFQSFPETFSGKVAKNELKKIAEEKFKKQ